MNSGKGNVYFQDIPFNSVKVFSATMMRDRANLGDNVTKWITEHADVAIAEIVVTQSSDEAFHCLTFTIFYNDPQVQN